MIFTPTKIEGVWVLELERKEDVRGYFARLWCEEEFRRHGLNPHLAQVNMSHNKKKGTLRGMHYQASPHEEAKLVRCVRGALFDVALDLRPASATLSQWFGTELSAENGKMLYVPEGCAHGFQTLTDDAEMIYCVSMPFNASAGRGARFDDAAFAIAWPLPVTVTSANDQLWPLMANHAEAQSARTAKQ